MIVAMASAALTVARAAREEIRLRADSGRLFALLDACDTPAVPTRARELGAGRAVSLYRGRADEELWAIAPYLLALDESDFDWIVTRLWSEPWGVLLIADTGLERLASHFRRYLTVAGPDGERWYFRFYDPRVLGRYLETCTEDELTAFFGPVASYICPSGDGTGCVVYSQPIAAPATAPVRPVIRRRR